MVEGGRRTRQVVNAMNQFAASTIRNIGLAVLLPIVIAAWFVAGPRRLSEFFTCDALDVENY